MRYLIPFAVLLVVAAEAEGVASAQNPFQRCSVERGKALAKYSACHHTARVKLDGSEFDITGFNEDMSKCRLRYGAAWSKIQTKSALAGTLCSLPRFLDNGDGTVTDRLTSLQWEMKESLDGMPNAANAHDADNQYTWSASGVAGDGPVFTDFLATLNTAPCFAGHCDWRLPTPAELETILYPEAYPIAVYPSVEPQLAPALAGPHWAAYSFDPATHVWVVAFNDGASGGLLKTENHAARAVRGGS